MRKIGITLAVLMPMLWLTGSSHGVALNHSRQAAAPGGWSVSNPIAPDNSRETASRQGQNAPDEACALEFSARGPGRRVECHPNLEWTFDPVVTVQSRFGGLDPDPKALKGATAPLGLANGWQFDWRAASEPRAPSAAS